MFRASLSTSRPGVLSRVGVGEGCRLLVAVGTLREGRGGTYTGNRRSWCWVIIGVKVAVAPLGGRAGRSSVGVGVGGGAFRDWGNAGATKRNRWSPSASAVVRGGGKDGQPAGGGGKKGSSDWSVTSGLAWAASVGIMRGAVGGNHGAARSVDRLATVAGDRAGVLPSMPCTSSGIEETSSSSSARMGCVPLLVRSGSLLDRAIWRAWELPEKTEGEVRRPVDTLYRRWMAEMLSESVSEWPSARWSAEGRSSVRCTGMLGCTGAVGSVRTRLSSQGMPRK